MSFRLALPNRSPRFFVENQFMESFGWNGTWRKLWVMDSYYTTTVREPRFKGTENAFYFCLVLIMIFRSIDNESVSQTTDLLCSKLPLNPLSHNRCSGITLSNDLFNSNHI